MIGSRWHSQGSGCARRACPARGRAPPHAHATCQDGCTFRAPHLPTTQATAMWCGYSLLCHHAVGSRVEGGLGDRQRRPQLLLQRAPHLGLEARHVAGAVAPPAYRRRSGSGAGSTGWLASRACSGSGSAGGEASSSPPPAIHQALPTSGAPVTKLTVAAVGSRLPSSAERLRCSSQARSTICELSTVR